MYLELTPEEQAKRDKKLLKKEELGREHDKILNEIEHHEKNSINLDARIWHFLKITNFTERILMEHIEPICSSESKL